MQKYQLWIDGAWLDSHTQDWLTTTNPFTNTTWAQIPRGDSHDVDMACSAAARAFPGWASLHPSARASYLNKLADLIDQHAETLARIEVQDNGKLYAEMLLQMQALPKLYRYFASAADKLLGSVVPVDKPDHFTYTRKEPLGVVAAIIPWNSPLLITTWKLAPALAAGNTVVLKPSEFTSASAFELGKLIEQAGFPKGVVNIVSGTGSEVGKPLIEHPAVAKVTFTGGTETGRQVYQSAAQDIKRVSLELGGKSPHIIFEDANLECAINGAISGIFAASGQTCIAGSRLLVQRNIHDEVVERVVSLAKTAKMGDPMSPDTQVGPVTTPTQHAKVCNYLKIATAEGAECVLGGKPATVANSPWFIEPSIYTGVNNNMQIAREEVFGPLLCILPFDDEQEAISIANDSPYGLAAGIWTQDLSKAHRVPAALQAGTVWVNTYRAFSYLMPFGGYKHSGIGKEAGHLAIHDYLQEKSVWINLSNQTRNPFVMG